MAQEVKPRAARRMVVTIEERQSEYGYPEYYILEDIELLEEGAPTNQGPFNTPGEAFAHLGYWMGWMTDEEQAELLEDVDG